MTDPEMAWQALIDCAVPVAIGSSAALAYVGKHGWPGLPRFLRLLTLCCFYGVVMYWLLELVDVPLSVKFGITGGGTFCFLELGDVIFERLKKLIERFELADLWGRRGGNGDKE